MRPSIVKQRRLVGARGSGEGSAVDINQQQIHAAADTPAITHPNPNANPMWPVAQARPVMPVYSVEDRLRRRNLRHSAGRIALFLIDVVMVNAAFLAAYYLRYVIFQNVQFTTRFVNQPLSDFEIFQIAVAIGVLFTFWVKGLYRLRSTGNWFRQFWTIASATTIAYAAFSAYTFIFRETDLFVTQTRALVAFTWVTIIVLVSLSRLVISGVLTFLYKRGIGLSNVLVVGSGRLGKLMMQQIAASPHLGYHVVGFVYDLDGEDADFGRFKALGPINQLDGYIRQNKVSDVIIALPSHQHQQILRTVRICERAGADFKLVPDLYELSLSRIDVGAIEGMPLIGLKRSLTGTWHYRVKRVIDVLGATSILAVSAPLWGLIALAIKLDSPGPVLYKQTRLGYRGEPFGCYKFRSMHVNADRMVENMRVATPGDERGKFKLRHDPRRTRVGRVIRGASLDELPQFLNVLKGQMSLVGPRPPLPTEYERYEDWEKARLEMPPGITGVWQVRGRSDIDFNEMVLMDLYYIENWSLRLDFQLLLQTVPAVLSRRGAY
jgi:exopolysaccharide biosynthesis polyprenyl glycosylphosphotransferase